MRKLYCLVAALFALVLSPVVVRAQSVTPNIGLQVPAYNQPNWQVPLNYDLNRLDLLLSGNLPLTTLHVTTLCLGLDCRSTWPAGGGGSPGTPVGSIQGNNAGSFEGIPDTLFDVTFGITQIENTGTVGITIDAAGTDFGGGGTGRLALGSHAGIALADVSTTGISLRETGASAVTISNNGSHGILIDATGAGSGTGLISILSAGGFSVADNSSAGNIAILESGAASVSIGTVLDYLLIQSGSALRLNSVDGMSLVDNSATGIAITESGAGHITFTGSMNFGSGSHLAVPTGAGFAGAANGQVGFDSTGLNYVNFANGVPSLFVSIPASLSVIDGRCAQFAVSGSNISLGQATTGCGVGSGNTTSTSLTTGTLPKANGANSIINSLLSDDATTLTYAGTGGLVAAALKVTGFGTAGCVQTDVFGVTSSTGLPCNTGGGGTAIFDSFQLQSNTPITTPANYLQIVAGATLSQSYTGLGTNVSPYVFTLGLPTSGVSAGSYTLANITVDAQGRITAAANGTALSNPMIALGDMIDGGASGVPARVIGNTTANKRFLTQTGTGSVSAAAVWSAILAGDLPLPTLSTVGGVEAINATTHQFITSLDTSGVLHQAQPSFADISGAATGAQLPNPGASSLGGVQSLTAAAHQFLTGLGTGGILTRAQPADIDLTGTTAGAMLFVTGGGVAEFATTPFAVLASGATNPQWVAPTGIDQCYKSAHTNFATTVPAFGACVPSLLFPQTVSGSVNPGGVPYFSTSTVMSSSAVLTQFQLLMGGGSGNPPAPLGAFGTTTTLLHGNPSGAPTFGPVVNGDIGSLAVTSPKMTLELTYFAQPFIFGATGSGTPLVDVQLGPQKDMWLVPKAGTVIEIDVSADNGTPNIIIGRNRNGSVSNLVSSALATASSGGRACSNAGGTASLFWTGVTCSSTLQNTSLNKGDTLQAVSGTAGGVADYLAVNVVYSTLN